MYKYSKSIIKCKSCKKLWLLRGSFCYHYAILLVSSDAYVLCVNSASMMMTA